MPLEATLVIPEKLLIEQPTPKKEIKPLTKKEIKELLHKKKVYNRLLEILDEVKSEVRSKQRKAKIFGFALSEDDKLSLAASELLMGYINDAKKDLQEKIAAIDQKLDS